MYFTYFVIDIVCVFVVKGRKIRVPMFNFVLCSVAGIFEVPKNQSPATGLKYNKS